MELPLSQRVLVKEFLKYLNQLLRSENHDEKSVEDGNNDLASKLDQVEVDGSGDGVPSKKSELNDQDSASNSNSEHNAADKGEEGRKEAASKDRKQPKHRFVVAVAGHETFVVGLKIENMIIKSMLNSVNYLLKSNL